MNIITAEENKAAIAKRGEFTFATKMTTYISPHGVLFDPSFLGDKFPDVDFYVRLNGYSNKKAYFHASVKITTLGFYDASEIRLRIIVEREKLAELVKFQVPVYLFAIDNKDGNVYVLNANKLDVSANLNGFPTKYCLTEDHLSEIYKEVADFYNCTKEITNFTTKFK